MSKTTTKNPQDIITQILQNAHRTTSGTYIAEVPLDLIQTDYDYQRKIKKNQLTSVFDLSRCSLLTLNLRDNEPDVLYVADGNHRCDAARSNGVKSLEAEIFVGLTKAEEALWFANQATFTKKINPKEEYKANLVWGDPIDTEIERLAKKYRLKVVDASKKDVELTGLGSARSIVRKSGSNALEAIFKLIKACKWNAQKRPYSSRWLDALHYVYEQHNGFSDDIIENFTKIGSYESPDNVYAFSILKHPTFDYRVALKATLDDIANANVTLSDIQAVGL